MGHTRGPGPAIQGFAPEFCWCPSRNSPAQCRDAAFELLQLLIVVPSLDADAGDAVAEAEVDPLRSVVFQCLIRRRQALCKLQLAPVHLRFFGEQNHRLHRVVHCRFFHGVQAQHRIQLCPREGIKPLRRRVAARQAEVASGAQGGALPEGRRLEGEASQHMRGHAGSLETAPAEPEADLQLRPLPLAGNARAGVRLRMQQLLEEIQRRRACSHVKHQMPRHLPGGAVQHDALNAFERLAHGCSRTHARSARWMRATSLCG